MKKIQEKNVLEVCNEVENNERILNIFLEVYNELDEIMNTFVNKKDKEKKSNTN